jgi:hypothetical protein
VWGLLGRTLPAREKRTNRRTLLEREGIDCTDLTNFDRRDAVLCALTAAYMNNNRFVAFGETADVRKLCVIIIIIIFIIV